MFKNWKDIVSGCVLDVDTLDKEGNVISTAKDVATLNCLPAVFLNVLTALLVFVGTFALFLFIFAGYKYMNTAGDPKKLEGARNTLIYGILGLLIVLFSFFIIWLISEVTGVKCIGSGRFGFDCVVPTPIP